MAKGEDGAAARAALGRTPTIVRVHSPLLPAIDSYIAESDNPRMSRAEAIRRVLSEALLSRS
jgi:hypothetical protein